MEADVQVLIGGVFALQPVYLKGEPVKIVEPGLIAGGGSSAEAINDPTATAENILRFNRKQHYQPTYLMI